MFGNDPYIDQLESQNAALRRENKELKGYIKRLTTIQESDPEPNDNGFSVIKISSSKMMSPMISATVHHENIKRNLLYDIRHELLKEIEKHITYTGDNYVLRGIVYVLTKEKI